MTDPVFRAGRDFILREGRLLEQHLAATLFDGAPPAPVLAALAPYQNADGGSAHALEPDTRCPESIPLCTEIALQTMHAAGAVDAAAVGRACDWLASVAAPGGAVSLALPVIERYPRAVHMTEWTYEPGLNPTAGIVGLLHALGVEHPWRDEAEAWCWQAIDAGLPTDAHAFGEVLLLLEHAGDAPRRDALLPALRDQLGRLEHYRGDADSEEYGVTPLHYAPSPASPWRVLFPPDVLAAHLDRLRRDQQDDGGWPLSWEPPSTASTLAYRGMETVRALRVLTAHAG
jgi:hypothetical protein